MACDCSNSAPGPCSSCSKAPTQETFLELWRRVLPPSYVDPIEHDNGGMGFDVPSAQAEIFACLAEAVETNVGAAYLRRWSGAAKPWASGPKRAVATLALSRVSGDGDFPLRSGAICLGVATDSFGRKQVLARFLTVGDVVLADGQIGPVDLPVVAEFPGYASNVPRGSIVEFEAVGERTVKAVVTSPTTLQLDGSEGDDFAGASGNLFVLTGSLTSQSKSVPRETLSSSETEIVFSPALDVGDVGASVTANYRELSSLGLRLDQPECAAGGVSGSLDAIASERGTGRALDESDEALSRRVEDIQDRVSPVAIEGILECELGACGLQWRMDEAGDPNGIGFVLDYHALDYGSLETVGMGHGAVLLDRAVRYYVVTVWAPAPVQFGLSFDDGPFPDAMDALDAPPLDGVVSEDSSSACIAAAWEALRGATEAGVQFEFRRATT